MCWLCSVPLVAYSYKAKGFSMLCRGRLVTKVILQQHNACMFLHNPKIIFIVVGGWDHLNSSRSNNIHILLHQFGKLKFTLFHCLQCISKNKHIFLLVYMISTVLDHTHTGKMTKGLSKLSNQSLYLLNACQLLFTCLYEETTGK